MNIESSRSCTQRQQYTAVLTHRPGQDRWPHVLPKAFVFPPAPQEKTERFARGKDRNGESWWHVAIMWLPLHPPPPWCFDRICIGFHRRFLRLSLSTAPNIRKHRYEVSSRQLFVCHSLSPYPCISRVLFWETDRPSSNLICRYTFREQTWVFNSKLYNS